MKKIVGIILIVTGAAAAAISLISQISVSVIGGEDGPTVIRTAGQIGGVSAIGTVSGIVLAAAGIIMIARKNKAQINRQKKI